MRNILFLTAVLSVFSGGANAAASRIANQCFESGVGEITFTKSTIQERGLDLRAGASSNKYLNSPYLEDKIDALNALNDPMTNKIFRVMSTSFNFDTNNKTQEELLRLLEVELPRKKAYVESGFLDPIAAIREASVTKEFKYSAEYLALVDKNFAEKSGRPHIQSMIAQQGAPVSCHFAFSATDLQRDQKIEQCQAVTKDILSLMAPKQIGEVSVSFLPLVKELVTDPLYRLGVARLALSMLDKVETVKAKREEGKPLELGTFYEDTKNTFLLLGLSDSDATRKALTIMTLYGTRGAGFSFLYELVGQEAISLYYSIQAVSIALGTLERASVLATQAYPYIPGMTTGCEYGRPYHFWMGYSLAKHLMEKGHSKKSILAAIHVLGVSYEMFASDGSNAGGLVLLPGYDWYTVETQKDIVFKTYGAWLALTGANPSSQPVDVELDRVINNTAPVDVSAFGEIPFYLRLPMKTQLSDPEAWIKRIAPNASYDALRQKL